jgi:hypothetical protein
MRSILRFTRVDETLKGPGEELLEWRLSLDFIYNMRNVYYLSDRKMPNANP